MKAKYAARVVELDPYVWARGARQEVPHYIALIGHDEFQHVVKWAWKLP